MSENEFIELFEKIVTDKLAKDPERLRKILNQLNWQAWLAETGYPKLMVNDYSPRSRRFGDVFRLVDEDEESVRNPLYDYINK